MTLTATTLQNLGEVLPNPVMLDLSITTPVCEGLNIALASFQTLQIQYQKHHFVAQGSEFYMLHAWFQDASSQVRDHVHLIGERVDGLGGVPVANVLRLAELCCFTPEPDGVFSSRQMIEHDLAAEQAIIELLRRWAAQAESLGDRATRYLYEQILLKTEDRAFHNHHFLAQDSLTLGLAKP